MSTYSCKVCNVEQVRVKGPKSGRTQRWLDAQGRHWSGYTCSPCASKAVTAMIAQGREGMDMSKRKRAVREEYTRQAVGLPVPLYQPKIRACGTCGVMNANYFNCSLCVSHRELISPDFYVGCLDESMYGCGV